LSTAAVTPSPLTTSRKVGQGRTLAAIALLLAATLGAHQSQALVLLFVVLPFLVAGVVIAFVAWRSSGGPPPIRTSAILASGRSAQAEVLSLKVMGTVVDMRPMVRFALRVDAGPDEAPFDLEVVQSLPRGVARDIKPGDVVEVRVTPDHSAGAVVWGGSLPG
jgi:hypothetical protein